MKHLALLLLTPAAFSARAQAVRYSMQPHLAIGTQPAPGYERPEYLGRGDSVQLIRTPPTANPHHISAAVRRYFVYVSYPAYRGQPAGQGWVRRQGLVSTTDSLRLILPEIPAHTIVTTKVVTTRHYVPVTEASRRQAATGKAGAKAAHKASAR